MSPTRTWHREDDGVLDDVAIERRMNGRLVQLTTPELCEAVRLLVGRGRSASDIARTLRLSGTRVHEILDSLTERAS